MSKLPLPKRYKIQAKRYPANKEWTEWAEADEYNEAVRQLDQIKELGFCGRIVDRLGIDRVVKMLEKEYANAQTLEYVKNPMAFALYAVWKQVDKEDKER